MRMLFVTSQGGYLSHFEDVVLHLADRGHAVRIASPSGDAANVPQQLRNHRGVSTTASPPHRSDRWGEVIEILRATRSYGRYWDPRFAQMSKLRFRAFRKLASELSADGQHLRTRCPNCDKHLKDEQISGLVHAAVAGQGPRLGLFGRLIEEAVPSDPRIEQFLRRERPDVAVITPLVRFDSVLPDYVKSARRLGIPTCAPVWSWDNLSNKGLMHVIPDRVLVWNETQRREAIELHDVPADRVEITGAPRFDRFLQMRPTQNREQFCAATGCDPTRPIIVYLGSSRWIAPDEIRFVQRWVQALRHCGNAAVESANIVLRPHPQQREDWSLEDLGRSGTVTLFAASYQNADQQLFNCLHHAAAAVGLNTSASIEAALANTPVFTIVAPEFREGQTGTMHFHYLLESKGGCVRVAESLDDHAGQLSALLAGDPDALRDRNAAFVANFVKGGLTGDTATQRTARAIEAAAGTWTRRVRRRIGFLAARSSDRSGAGPTMDS